VVWESGRSPSDLSELVEEIIIINSAVDSFAGRKDSDASVFVGDFFVDIVGNLVKSTLEVYFGDRVLPNPLSEIFYLSNRSLRS
jgi:hypothetical protein